MPRRKPAGSRLRLDRPLDADVLPVVARALPASYWKRQRWFGGKARPIARVTLRDHAILQAQPLLALALVQVRYRDGGEESYTLPLLFREANPASPDDEQPIIQLETPGGPFAVYDALASEDCARLLFALLRERERLRTARGWITGWAVEALAHGAPPAAARLLSAQQSHTSIVYDDAWILKVYRRLEDGKNRDLEVAEFFQRYAPFPYTPPLGGYAEYVETGGGESTLALLTGFVRNQGDGWSYVVGQFPSWLRRLARTPGAPSVDGVREALGAFIADVERLGEITAALHRALGSRDDVADFAPQPVEPPDAEEWRRDAERQASLALVALRAHARHVPGAAALLEREVGLRQGLEALGAGLAAGSFHAIQIHGDYHLGQVLKTDDGFVVIDFEGEPARPLQERRSKQPAPRDVAGMLRSFDYAASVATLQAPADLREVAERWTPFWEQAVREAYLDAYLDAIAGSGLVPPTLDQTLRLIRFFEVSKALYELNYELNNRPSWVPIPLGALERLLEVS